MAVRVRPLLSIHPHTSIPVVSTLHQKTPLKRFAARMATGGTEGGAPFPTKVIDSHLHVWASPAEAGDKYPYFPGQEPTLPGDVDFLLQCMDEAAVDGALIVQPINHKFDHSLVSSVLKKYPTKFVGCCLANPAEDGSGIGNLEQLVLKDGYGAVRFNPYLWPSSQKEEAKMGKKERNFCIDIALLALMNWLPRIVYPGLKDGFDYTDAKLNFAYANEQGGKILSMTNEVGRALFSKAGELGIPVGFMCMKGLNLHISEIEELCKEFPSTVVLLDHLAFCKPPLNDEENRTFSELLRLSRYPQVYIKFSALFRVSRMPFPYLDLSDLLSKLITHFGVNRIMWGSDFPFVIPECGYKGAKDAVSLIAEQVSISSSELEWIMGRTVVKLFPNGWL